MPPAMPPEVRTLIDAANSGDTDAFLACFTPHLGFVDHWGRKFYGSESIRGWSDADFIGKHVTLKVVHFYAHGVEVVVIATVESDEFNGPGTFTFRVDKSQVIEMRITA